MQHMSLISGLPVVLWLLSFWATPVRATNEVFVVTMSSVPSVNINLAALRDGVLGSDEPGTNEVTLVAWTAKFSQIGLPPEVGEEAIVLVHRVDTSATNRWVLAYLTCDAYSIRGKSWSPVRIPSLPWKQDFMNHPSAGEIAQFIRSTNFGVNDYRSDVTVLRTIAYMGAAEVVQSLSEGISPGEKTDRFRAVLRIEAHPRPPR